MNRGLCTFFFILPLICGATFAQEPVVPADGPPRNLVSFSSGLALGAVRDEMMSPLKYAGTSLPLQLMYRYDGEEFRHAVLLSYSTNDLTSSISDARTSAHTIASFRFDLSYGITRKVLELEALRTSCFAGVELSGLLELREHRYQAGQSHTNSDQMAGLGVRLLTETVLQPGTGNVLRCEIGMPFLSYVILLGKYNANVNSAIDDLGQDGDVVWRIVKRGRFVSVGDLLDIRATVSYEMHLDEHWALDAQYRFQYYAATEYENLFAARTLRNQFLLGVTVLI